MGRTIAIRGAKEHNLKDFDISIPRDAFVVITGLSGSGKSSLAFDTIYAEGQRRYLESLSAYARQFMEQMKKPAVDAIDGLSPSISIEQKNISKNPRSTVGTVTEIYDFLRLLYARTGKPFCPTCGKPIQSQTIQQIVEQIKKLEPNTKFAVCTPIVRGKKGEYQKELRQLRSQGFVRAKIDGEVVDLSAPIRLKKNIKHDISVYVDRLILNSKVEARLIEAVEIASQLSQGLVEIENMNTRETTLYSTRFACASCGTGFPELEPRSFSFNSPHGACPDCNGLGEEDFFDPELIVPNPGLSIAEGAVLPWASQTQTWKSRLYEALEKDLKISTKVAWNKLTDEQRKILFHGSEKPLKLRIKEGGQVRTMETNLEGIIPTLERQWEEAEYEDEVEELERFLVAIQCRLCEGTRLKKEALSVKIDDKNIAEITELSVTDCSDLMNKLEMPKTSAVISKPILKEIRARLTFLRDVGLGYLSLNRSAATLSGGEAQRVRLATQIGSNLVGVLYILDEPSIGLHHRDNNRLIKTLTRLRDQGNSVIVVEHDEDTIRAADYVIDIGPGAGVHGGELVSFGPPADISKNKKSLTGAYLTQEKEIAVPNERRPYDNKNAFTVCNATRNNLKGIDVTFPLKAFISVTGVSGSGKSSLIIDSLLPALQHQLAGGKGSKQFPEIQGLDLVDKVIHINQAPIGRTPRSNPATYTGVFTEIRQMFANLPEARMRGYSPSRFSFNVQGGRCEACRGEGNLKITMHFLPDVYVPCEICQGRRYNRETLQVHYRGKSIADVLQMPVEEAVTFFERIPQIRTKLQTLVDVGLGYVHLGQNAVTLSGGEAQRIKLSRELNRRATGKTVYILDEPTTGLHFEDVNKLMQILHRLVDQGNTVIVIEHQLDVIKQADYLIDLGPEGGKAGGRVLFQGPPEELLNVKESFTGMALKQVLKKGGRKKSRPPSQEVQPSQ